MKEKKMSHVKTQFWKTLKTSAELANG